MKLRNSEDSRREGSLLCKTPLVCPPLSAPVHAGEEEAIKGKNGKQRQ